MPPPAPSLMLDDDDAESAFTLSDADVQIIWEILRRAEQVDTFASQPFHAIFPAYRDVLAQYDITSSNDRTYLRFLYKLEQRRKPHQTLYNAFEHRLAQLGIELRFSSDGGDDNNDQRDSSTRHRPSVPVLDELRDLRPRSRRASFSSFIEFAEHTQPRTRPGSRTSVSSLPNRTTKVGHLPSQIPDKGLPENRWPSSDTDKQSAIHLSSPVVITTEKAQQNVLDPQLPFAGKSSSTAGHSRSERSALPYRERRHQLLFDVYPQTSLNDAIEYGYSKGPIRLQNVDNASKYQPSETQLVRDADTFDYFRMRDLLRSCLRDWRDVAFQQKWENSVLEARSKQFYNENLLRSMLRRIANILRLRKHLQHAEEVFAIWEARARKARDTYLLMKAFTHWTACMTEERQRSTAARHHILRMKFFNAWREVTAVNQLKIQIRVLGKSFTAWKRRFIQAWVHENKAVTVYQDNLLEHTYWNWFWKFCEERAPQWRDALLKRRYLQRMSGAITSKKDLSNRVDQLRGGELIYRYFHRWRKADQILLEQNDAATRCNQLITIGRALPQWQRQLRLAPAARQVISRAQKQTLSGAFQAWARRTHMKREAEKTNTLRIARNAWTIWNDQLRVSYLLQQINDRLAVEALYRWVLAERETLLQRVRDERLVTQAACKVFAKRQVIKERLHEASESGLKSHKQRLLRQVLQCWHHKVGSFRKQNKSALEHYEPRTVRAVIHAWHAQYEHQVELERWAVEAVYFVRTSHAIQTWQLGVAQSRKRRIQAAYAEVRVKQKKKQAQASLQIIRNRLHDTKALRSAATSMKSRKRQSLQRQLFLSWYSSLESVNHIMRSANSLWLDSLLSKPMASWARRIELTRQQSSQSLIYGNMHIEKTSYETLRKLQLRVLERQNLESKARTIRDWNLKRHARRLMRFWVEQALSMQNRGATTNTLRSARSQRKEGTPESPSFSSGTLIERTLTQGTLREPEASSTTGFAQSSDILISTNHTSLPGYLSTPSKRAARARAMVAEPSTTTPATDLRAMRRAQALRFDIAYANEIISPMNSWVSEHFEPLDRGSIKHQAQTAETGRRSLGRSSTSFMIAGQSPSRAPSLIPRFTRLRPKTPPL